MKNLPYSFPSLSARVADFTDRKTFNAVFNLVNSIQQALQMVSGATNENASNTMALDGSQAMAAPLKLAAYANTGALPAAASWTGALAYVTGSGIYYSNGSSWVGPLT